MKNTLFVLILLVVAACQQKSKDSPSSTSKNDITPINPTKQLHVGFVIVEGVYNSELVAPMDIFHHTIFHHDKGMKVFTIAPEKKLLTTFEGLKILPDYAFHDPALPPIDILVVPSAEFSMTTDLENDKLIDFVKKQGVLAQYVISLCDGAFVLAHAGLVNGKHSTTFPGDVDKYRTMFPNLSVHENVSFVHDGSLITSQGGAKSYDPALYLCHLLYGEKAAKGLAGGLVIDWNLDNLNYLNIKETVE